MVAYTSYLYNLAACGINQFTNIRMNAVEVCITNGSARCFDMEYQMYVELAQRLCHAFTLLPFQGVGNCVFVSHTQGAASLALGYTLPWAFSPRYFSRFCFAYR